jgi:hypothetical protein
LVFRPLAAVGTFVHRQKITTVYMGINSTENNTETQNTQKSKQNVQNEKTNIKRIIKTNIKTIITLQRAKT